MLTVRSAIVMAFFFLGTAVPTVAFAEGDSLSLSVTPPLYQLNVAPGDIWKSSLKVINNNPFELTVYAEVHNFAPQGEDGQGSFLPREGGFDPSGPDLAHWLEVTSQPIVIAPEQSIEVPVSMVVPQNAPPGGHFAAILVGTRPPEVQGASAVRTSQVVTSLFFLRVAGDVSEVGTIREFSVDDLLYETPEAHFVVRFENSGNVHVQPQGEIHIVNMWGRERGVIPINQKSYFGNVLPQSIRKFNFSWKGESSLADIGRYTAEVTLTFGQDSRKNVSQKTHFWVVPVRGALVTLSILAAFLYFIVWALRRYVRRVLYLSGAEELSAPSIKTSAPTLRATKKDLALPLREGVLDLRKRVVTREKDASLLVSLWQYVGTYRLFFSALVLVCVFGGIAFYFLSDVLRDQKAYEITLERGDTSVTLTSEEVIKEQMTATSTSLSQPVTQAFSLQVQNETETAGVGSAVALQLEDLGYVVSGIRQTASGGEQRQTSVIVYDPLFEREALTLSNQLGGIAVSVAQSTTTTSEFVGIHLYVGEDMVH